MRSGRIVGRICNETWVVGRICDEAWVVFVRDRALGCAPRLMGCNRTVSLFWVCGGGLLQTDPQERAKTTTASSGCRPRPTAPDPVVSHGNSQMQATAGLTSAGEATSTQPRSTRAQARNIDVREQVDYPIYLYVVSYPSMSEAIIHPSLHRGPPATRVRWRPEVALAGVAEQHPQSAVHKLGRTRLRRGTDAGRRTRRVADTTRVPAPPAPVFGSIWV